MQKFPVFCILLYITYNSRNIVTLTSKQLHHGLQVYVCALIQAQILVLWPQKC